MDASRNNPRFDAWRVKLSDDGDAADSSSEVPSSSNTVSSSQSSSTKEKVVSVEARCSQAAVLLRNSLRVPIMELGAQVNLISMDSV
jgi:hypothetical protein